MTENHLREIFGTYGSIQKIVTQECAGGDYLQKSTNGWVVVFDYEISVEDAMDLCMMV